MTFFQAQTNMLSLLHYQHRLYTHELAVSHRTLSKLYKKLERTERGLSDWKERGLMRKDKRKLQWDRATTKTLVKESEAHQALLRDYLRQCSDLIASYSPQFFQSAPEPWNNSPLSPMANSFAPGSPVPPTSWTAGPFEERVAWNREEPQYWDLSMLREGQPSVFTGTPDSGFDEPFRQGVSNNFESTSEVTAGVTDSARSLDRIMPSNRSSISEKDTLPELAAPLSPAKLGAEAPKCLHRRRYSENAIATIEHRLAKALRVGSVPPCNRTVSETRVSKE
jgi:hypothetical protein